MRHSTAGVLEVAAGAVLLALALALVLPWPSRPPPAPRRAGPEGEAPAAPRSAGEAAVMEPRRVAVLFGADSSPPTPAPAAPSAATPTPAPDRQPSTPAWLRYVGSAVDADGSALYFLKDTRNGKVIRVGGGGWSLVEASADRIVIRVGEEVYAVSRR